LQFGPDGICRELELGGELPQVGLESGIQEELYEDVDPRSGRDHAAQCISDHLLCPLIVHFYYSITGAFRVVKCFSLGFSNAFSAGDREKKQRRIGN
jgi:hypothetical protein